MRIALAQLNPTVGDLAGNAESIVAAAHTAAADDAELLVTAELSVIGYPPRDLLRRRGVVAACEAAAADIARRVGGDHPGLTILLGHPRLAPGGMRGVRNSVTAWRGGERVATIDKRLLPGYDVFDEDRYFDAANEPQPILELGGRRLGLVICEDLWRSIDAGDVAGYDADPVADLLAAGADLLIAAHATPFVLGKERRHAAILADVARRGAPLVSVNQVGANDDLVFDGRSRVLDADGAMLARLPGFETAVVTVDVPRAGADAAAAAAHPGASIAADDPGLPGSPCDGDAETFAALRLAVADYVHKTGHQDVVVGISGGIDSALVAALAVAALGPGHVHGLMMPSRHSSPGSVVDAADLAARLGIATRRLEIEPAHAAVEATLRGALGHDYAGLPDENVQARLRGLLLMGWTNARGSLLLATSNKSELAVGYSTLYGDMCGAVAPIGDLVKGRVVSLCQWMNANAGACGFAGPPIPVASITKPPSAELRPDQRDSDSLPAYDRLDAIVTAVVDEDQDLTRGGAGAPGEDARRPEGQGGLASDAEAADWARAIDRSEYKRFQSSIVPKITPRAFGPGRPMPVVMRWRPVGAEAGGPSLDGGEQTGAPADPAETASAGG